MELNISYLELPLYENGQILNTKLKDAMYYTAQPLYKNIKIKFEELHKIVKSDYRQYSPFEFKDGIKKGENWSNDNQNLIILDIDDGLTLNEAKNYFKAYKYLICTTKSHKKDKKGFICDRFRVILEATNIPRGDEYFEYMRVMEKTFPFIDKQVNTKTGAFLGFADCEYFYNNGSLLDMNTFRPVKMPKKEAIQYHTRQKEHKEDIDIAEIKNKLSREVVADIVNSCGFEVNRNFKFKVRDERTPSCSISHDCVVMDFGNQDAFSDIFGLLMYAKSMSFKEATDYVKNFV